MSSTAAPKPPTAATSHKYLTFQLASEDYGLRILNVREIIGFTEITPVPRTPDYVKGVINLRGQVIPVIDLRAKLRMPTAEVTKSTCIVVVEVAGTSEGSASRRLLMGILVDRVSEVLNIAPDAVEEAPSFGTAVDTEFILGIAKIGKSVKILLDIDRVLSSRESAEVAQVATDSPVPNN